MSVVKGRKSKAVAGSRLIRCYKCNGLFKFDKTLCKCRDPNPPKRKSIFDE